MPGPTTPRLITSILLGFAFLAVLIQGLEMFARAAVRQAEIDAGASKFVYVGER